LAFIIATAEPIKLTKNIILTANLLPGGTIRRDSPTIKLFAFRLRQLAVVSMLMLDACDDCLMTIYHDTIAYGPIRFLVAGNDFPCNLITLCGEMLGNDLIEFDRAKLFVERAQDHVFIGVILSAGDHLREKDFHHGNGVLFAYALLPRMDGKCSMFSLVNSLCSEQRSWYIATVCADGGC